VNVVYSFGHLAAGVGRVNCPYLLHLLLGRGQSRLGHSLLLLLRCNLLLGYLLFEELSLGGFHLLISLRDVVGVLVRGGRSLARLGLGLFEMR
jgi:hypothetical protein